MDKMATMPDPALLGPQEIEAMRNEADLREVSPAKQKEIDECAEQIKEYLRTMNECAQQIGLRLNHVHKYLGSNHFQEWLRENFNMTVGAASKYMAIAREFPNDDLTNCEVGAIYLLSRKKVPESAREEARKCIQSGKSITYRDADKIARKHGVAPACKTPINRSINRIKTLVQDAISGQRPPHEIRLISATLRSLADELDVLAQQGNVDENEEEDE